MVQQGPEKRNPFEREMPQAPELPKEERLEGDLETENSPENRVEIKPLEEDVDFESVQTLPENGDKSTPNTVEKMMTPNVERAKRVLNDLLSRGRVDPQSFNEGEKALHALMEKKDESEANL